MRVLGLALALALLVACGNEEAPREPDGTAVLRLDGAAEPALFRAGDGLLLLAARDHAVVAASYDGAWSDPAVLSSPGEQVSSPWGAFNDDGVGVVVWSGQRLEARVRDARGHWSEAETLGELTYVEDVQVSDRGDVAIVGYTDESVRGLALRPAGGAWEVTDLGWYDATSIGLDDEGGVHAVLTGTDRGGGGEVVTRHLVPGASWSAPMSVPVDRAATEAARILVRPDGGEVVVVGTISPNWHSTFDTQFYWPTAFQVLERATLQEPLAPVWSRDGATRLRAVLRGDDLDLTWVQNAEPRSLDGDVPLTVPTMTVLAATTVGGPERTLARTPVEETQDDLRGRIEFSTALGCDEPALVWRPVDVKGTPGEVTAHTARGDRSYAGTVDADTVGPAAALACAGGNEPWLARVVDDAVVVGPVT